MDATARSAWLLEQEARALLTRLGRIRPFVLYETMVPAASPSPVANSAVHGYIAAVSRQMRATILEFLSWLREAPRRGATPPMMQKRFTLVRLRFNIMISQFDIFADVITQRSEYQTGVWLSGLDSFAADALKLPGGYYDPPPVVCYLDRGQGAAIRRARTRLPGGGDNPVGIIRIPRERMVGSGIASSLVHEVGHQAAALLDLVVSLRAELQRKQEHTGEARVAWQLYERWISEIVADFWSVARVGITSTMGLISVVSLPNAFVFRISLDDPHPVPWVRVMLSARIGSVLYPDPQWSQISDIWASLYPSNHLQGEKRAVFQQVMSTMDEFVALLVNHRPKSLRGKSLREVMQTEERTPARLSSLWRRWREDRREMSSAAPTILLAVLGQARVRRELTPEAESRLVGHYLAHWAVKDALDVSSQCAEAAHRNSGWVARGKAELSIAG